MNINKNQNVMFAAVLTVLATLVAVVTCTWAMQKAFGPLPPEKPPVLVVKLDKPPMVSTNVATVVAIAGQTAAGISFIQARTGNGNDGTQCAEIVGPIALGDKVLLKQATCYQNFGTNNNVYLKWTLVAEKLF
jgi:hypothetical protein